MAYKRHSQGGRFKAANFGDLGLRALKDQQERQVKSLKDQAREEAQMGYEHLREMRGSAAREIEHNRQLQNFYSKRDNLAIENTQFRGKTEYDRLMGEAKEYEKQAKFWGDFSSTYAQQYQKAATDIYDLATTEQSNRQLDVIDADPKYHKFVASYSKLNNLASKAQVDEAVSVLRDKNATEEQKSKYLSHIVELGFRMNHKTKLALLNRELANWEQEALNLRALATRNEPPLQWNEKTAGQFFYLRAREIMRAYGVDPSSKAGKEFLKGVEEKATDTRNKLSKVSDANASEEYRRELSESTKNLIGKSSYAVSNGSIVVSGSTAIEYNNDWNTRVIYEGAGARINPDTGSVIEPTGNNVHNNFVQVMESDIMSGRFASKEQARRHTILQLKPGAKVTYEDDGKTMVYNEKDSWLGQHPSLADEFDDAWRKYEKQEKTKFDEDKVLDDHRTVNNLKDRALGSMNETIPETLPDGTKNPEYLNLADPETLAALQKEHRGKEETIKFLGNFEVYNQYDLNGDIVTAKLTAEYKAGNLKNLEEHLAYLPPDVQAEWESKLNQLKILDRKNYLGTALTRRASGFLSEILGVEAAKKEALNTDHFQATIGYFEQDILATFEEEYEKDPEASDAELIARTRTEIKRKIAVKNADGTMGEGVYRRSNTGTSALSTKFLIDPALDIDNEKAKATLDQVEKKFLANNSIAFSNGLKAVLKDGKFQVGKDASNKVYLVSLNEADAAIIAINEGREPKFNETINHIVKNQPKSKDGTRLEARDIWNMYFKGVGIDTQIKPNVIDFASSNTENSTLKADTSRMNEANKCAVGAVCKMSDDGIINTGEKSAEGARIEQNDSTRDFVVQSLEGTLTEQQQKILYPHSHTLRKDTHIPWWVKPWAGKTSTKSPLRLNRL